MNHFILSIGFCLVIVSLCFILMWVWQIKSKNAGLVDVIWAISFPLQALIYFTLTDGFIWRKIILMALIFFWGGRLGIHLFFRNWGHNEDRRYAKMRSEYGSRTNIKFLIFYLFQAVLATLLAFPFYIIQQNKSNEFSTFEITGSMLLLVAIIGESLADFQLRKFKSKVVNRMKVCQEGLWYYSRHPNYFFEWLIWISIFIMSLGSEYGFFSVLSPALMLHFLINVTGIMMTEEQILVSKGAAYRHYQRTTSPFVPWFKRDNKSF